MILPIDDIAPRHRPAALYATALLVALARDEHRGRRPKRLLDPQRLTWQRFRGALPNTALATLLFEDAAVTQPVPFDPTATQLPAELLPGALPDDAVTAWLDALTALALDAPSDDYILAQARALGLPTRLARTAIHKPKPHYKVLELPGTGGQLAHAAAAAQPDIDLQDVFTIAADGWRELTLAGLVAVDAGLTAGQLRIVPARTLADLARLGPFDAVLGLDPDKGGAFELHQIHEAHLVAPGGDVQLL